MKLCAKCGKVTTADNPYCEACRPKAVADRAATIERNTKAARKRYKPVTEHRAFYSSAAWQSLSKARMSYDNYLCVECAKQGIITAATAVHHTKPLWMNFQERFNFDLLESVCDKCHARMDAELRKKRDTGGTKKV